MCEDIEPIDCFGGVNASISGTNILMGLPYDRDGGHNAGAAYVVNKSNVGWSSVKQTQQILPDETINEYNIKFGKAVAIDGDYAVVGCPNQDRKKGRAYVFKRDGIQWNKVSRLTAAERSYDDYFGMTVDIHENTIVISASNNKAYVFEMPQNGWENMTETAILTSPNGIGANVKISNNFIAATGKDDMNGTKRGCILVYEKPVSGWKDMTETTVLLPSNRIKPEEVMDGFGYTMDIDDNTIVVGANRDGGWQTYLGGIVYIYEKSALGWPSTETASLRSSEFDFAGRFGQSVSIHNNTIAVSDKESVRVFEKPTTGWESTTENIKLSPLNYDGKTFGSVVTVWDNTIMVGTGDSKEMAYLYKKPSTGWTSATETETIQTSNFPEACKFGSAIAMSENCLIIGAPGSSYYEEEWNSGIAYFYGKSQTVTFLDWDGTEIDKQTVAFGKSATEPSRPTRAGFVFKGWDKTFDKVYNSLTVKAQYDISTNLDEVKNHGIKVYPNPAKDILNVVFEDSDFKQHLNIIIYNSAGAVVYQQNNVSKKNIVNIASFNPGLYFVNVGAQVFKINVAR